MRWCLWLFFVGLGIAWGGTGACWAQHTPADTTGEKTQATDSTRLDSTQLDSIQRDSTRLDSSRTVAADTLPNNLGQPPGNASAEPGFVQRLWTKLNTPIDPDKKKSSSFLALPAAGYGPETGFYGGLVLRVNLEPPSNGNERNSFLQTMGIYTQEQQYVAELEFQIFTPGERFVVIGFFDFREFPEYFYGIGNDLSDAREQYSFNQLLGDMTLLHRIKPDKAWYLGPRLRVQHRYNMDIEPDHQLLRENIPGAEGATTLGIGYSLQWDKRDDLQTPTQGHLLRLSQLVYHTAWLSDYTFTSLELDARKYFPLDADRQHLFALQFRTLFNFGDPPFDQMAALGHRGHFRGYYRGRWRDKHVMTLQAEYRLPVWWRFGLVVWTGLGDVFNQPSDLSFRRLKPTAGLGLRFNMRRPGQHPLNVRVDFGFGAGSNAYYVGISEAF